MSREKNIFVENNKIVIKPIKAQPTPILVKKENKLKLYHGESSSVLIKNIKFGAASTLYTEEVLFESKPGSLIRDSPVKVTIINRLDLLKNAIRTLITYFDQLNGKVLTVKTSDQIARFIGQNNYETILTALCSIKDEEIKVKAIMALLTNELVENQSTQTEDDPDDKKKISIIKDELSTTVEEKSCQTDENCMDLIFKLKQKKRIKRSVLTPYVVKDPPKKVIKKVIVNPNNAQNRQIIQDIDKHQNISIVLKNDIEPVNAASNLPEIHLNEDSNDNCSISGSLCSGETVLRDAEAILESIANHTTKQEGTMVTVPNTQKHYIHLPNGTSIEVPVKPEHPFHMASPDILKGLSKDDKVKVLTYQAYLDYKLCLNTDSDGYLPLHNAVLSDDVDLLRRQCVVLRYRQQSLDITAGNMTALQMSIYEETSQCTALLLQHGADPFVTDEEHRTCLHLAAESASDSLRAVINHCQSNARSILQYHAELWKPEYESRSQEELGTILLQHMCAMVDSQGYSALMLTAKAGNYTGAMMLLEASPDSINQPMPNSGQTAIFLAVEGACHDASNRGNKSKIADRYYRTISILLENGADLSIANYSGTTINDLLAENGNAELSTLFSNKVTSKYWDGAAPDAPLDAYILYKSGDGEVSLAEVKKMKNKTKTEIDNKDFKMAAGGTANKMAAEIKIIKSEPDKQDIIMEAGTSKIISTNKPIILENTKLIVDPNSLKTAQQIKIISAKDKVVNIRKKVDTKLANNDIAKTIITAQKKSPTKPSRPIIVINNLNNTSAVTQQNELLKRKSENGSGPSGKKLKVKSLKT